MAVKAAEFLDPQVDVEHAVSRRPVMLYAEADQGARSLSNEGLC